MDTKGEHLAYLSDKGRFTIDCSHEVFSPEEIFVLEKWGHWFLALASGDLKPFTEAQERFIKETAEKKKTGTVYEIAWRKYRVRKQIEKEKGDRLKVKYTIEDDTFYSRDDKKKLSRINFNTMAQNHRKGLKEK